MIIKLKIKDEIGIGRRMEWAGWGKHLGGIPRKMVIMSVGAFAKATANVLDSTSVHNADTLFLLTFPSFVSTSLSWKCIPIIRGGGIYQEHMNEALDRLRDGDWLHTFPEGKVFQEDAPIRRLKWGTASPIVRSPVTPIVLPIVHHGFEKVMPENYIFGRRPPFPLCNKKIQITVGEPIEFDIPKMKQIAISASKDLSFPSCGWPRITPCGLDEAAQRYLYTTISEHIRTVMKKLRNLGKTLTKSDV